MLRRDLIDRGTKIFRLYSGSDLDVFKFSINNILNSDGDIVEKPVGTHRYLVEQTTEVSFFLK